MPWQIALPITLLLFLLAPFFRKWVDLVLWPKLADWWAARSKANLQKRIQQLEVSLARIEVLPAFSEFEDIMLMAVMALFKCLTAIPAIGILLYVFFRTLQHRPLDNLSSLFLWLFAAMIMIIGMCWERFVGDVWLARSPKYRQSLHKNIDKLKASLG